MDAIPYIKKPDDFSDGPADDSEGRVSIHDMTVNTDGILDYLHEFKDAIKGNDIFTVGEANGISEDQLPKWIGKNGVLDTVFEFDHLDNSEVWCKGEKKTLSELKYSLTESQEVSEIHGWIPVFFENHDQPRSINVYFPEDADPVLAGKAMGTILLTGRGTPFIYQGEELGMTNSYRDSIDSYNDLNTYNQYETAIKEGFSEEEALAIVNKYSRDNARTPMQWDSSEYAGFSDVEPWLSLGNNYDTVNAEKEDKDDKSVLNWYKELIKLRRDNPTLIDGDYSEVLSDSDTIYAYIRKNSSGKMLVIVNFSGEEVNYDPLDAGLSESDNKEIIVDSYEDGNGKVGTLRPYEAMIIK